VEVTSHWGVHRRVDNEALKDPLCVLASKTSVGNQVEASGTLQLLKAIYSAQFGHVAPLAHLHRANPHIDPFGQPLLLANEAISFSGASSFTGVLSQGFGGTNVYLLTWAMENVAKVFPPPPVAPPQIAFWPGGGGEIEHELLPSEKDGYFIIGTWSRWETPQRMDRTAPGEYRFTVTLGENRWEQFQIWLDGSAERVLHPGLPRMPQGCPVEGPDPDFKGGTEVARSTMAPTWMIDGRGGVAGYEHGEGIVKRLTDGTSRDEEALADVGVDAFTLGTTEAGKPGDQYEVLLQVHGKWRMVTWQKASLAEGAEMPAGSTGSYYLAGTWNDWALEEMRSDPTTPGLFTGDIVLPPAGMVDFLIVRDKDWNQQLYPNVEVPFDDPNSVLGPDDWGSDTSQWWLQGLAGERYHVHFQRSFDQDGAEFRRVTWEVADDAAALPDVAEEPPALEAAGPSEAGEQPPSAEAAPAVDTGEQLETPQVAGRPPEGAEADAPADVQQR